MNEMNGVQQLMKPGYGNNNLEWLADICLTPARYLWEEKSVFWLRNNERSRPVYRCEIGSNEDADWPWEFEEDPLNRKILIGIFLSIGAAYCAGAALASVPLAIGLGLKKISLEKDPKAKEYNKLVVEHLNQCDDMGGIDEAYRCQEYFSPGKSGNERDAKMADFQEKIDQLNQELKFHRDIFTIVKQDLSECNSINLISNQPFFGPSQKFAYTYIGQENYKISTLVSSETHYSSTLKELAEKIGALSNEIINENSSLNVLKAEVQKYKNLSLNFIKSVYHLMGEEDSLI